MTDGDELARILASLVPAEGEPAADVRAIRARVDLLVDLLVARGALTEGHRRLLAKVGVGAAATEAKKVRLRVYVDKYTVPSSDVDCEARMHLCHGRCCWPSIELTTQDLEEGKLRWTIDEPYLLRKDADGRCTYQDRGTGGCNAYQHRPATCRIYDCRQDNRVWLDFEKRIPAPMPEGLGPLNLPKGTPRST